MKAINILCSDSSMLSNSIINTVVETACFVINYKIAKFKNFAAALQSG